MGQRVRGIQELSLHHCTEEEYQELFGEDLNEYLGESEDDEEEDDEDEEEE